MLIYLEKCICFSGDFTESYWIVQHDMWAYAAHLQKHVLNYIIGIWWSSTFKVHANREINALILITGEILENYKVIIFISPGLSCETLG